MKKYSIFLAVICLAGGLHAAEVMAPMPIRNVKVGQWITVRMFTLFGFAEQKQTILAVDGEGDEQLITIRTEVTVDGEPVDSGEDTITRALAEGEQTAALDDMEDVEYTPITIEVNGQQIDAVRIDFIQNGRRGNVVLSEAIPISGLVRMEMEGLDDPAIEIIDYGESD